MVDLSNSGWAVLEQLAQGGVWDGALVSKEGRNELVKLGLARRICGEKLIKNELTRRGAEIAIHYVLGGWRWH